ncbi:MAG: MFS transporter [Armatimonadota bacterium]
MKPVDTQHEHEIIAALDRAPLTQRHLLFLGALLGALVFDYAKPFTISFVIPGMRQMWGLSEVRASYLPIAGLSGTTVGSVLWGFAADRIGRRATLLWTVGIFSAATVCGLALQYWQSLVACFVMGLGVGGEAPIVFALAAEYLPVRVRGRLLLFLGIVGATAGYALAAAIATVATALFPDTVAWRLMWLVQLLPAVLILTLRSRIVPESARYLLARNRLKEARAAAEALVGSIAETATQVTPLSAMADFTGARSLYGRTLAFGLFSFAWGLVNYGFLTWVPTLLRRMGYTGVASSGYLALSALIAVPAFAVTVHLVARWSTRWMLVAYAIGAALTLGVLGAGAAAGKLTPLVLLAISSLVLFFMISIGGVFAFYTAEVFPTAVRVGRSGLVSATGRLGGVLGPYVLGLLLASANSMLGLLIPLAAALVVAALVLVVAGVETRGRSLEQIAGDESVAD